MELRPPATLSSPISAIGWVARIQAERSCFRKRRSTGWWASMARTCARLRQSRVRGSPSREWRRLVRSARSPSSPPPPIPMRISSRWMSACGSSRRSLPSWMPRTRCTQCTARMGRPDPPHQRMWVHRGIPAGPTTCLHTAHIETSEDGCTPSQPGHRRTVLATAWSVRVVGLRSATVATEGHRCPSTAAGMGWAGQPAWAARGVTIHSEAREGPEGLGHAVP